MLWYNPKTWFAATEKLNPAQSTIATNSGSEIGSDAVVSYSLAFDKLEAVNRGVNMLVSACASLDYDVKDAIPGGGATPGVKAKTLNSLLNFTPNPYQSAQDFRTNIFTDFVMEGNIFIYWDGRYMYHLPAINVQVIPDSKTFIKGYKYNNSIDYSASEIIHVKDLNSDSIFRGSSRLKAASRSIAILYKMQAFQEQFFDNGAIPGIVFETENTLSTQAKDRTILGWMQKYSPKNGAKRPLILDSGLKMKPIAASNFQEMDFDISIKTHDTKILKALGVPPILMDGGNNANISPNLRLFYLETVLPITTKLNSAFERFFGWDVQTITSNVSALQPELKEIAAYYTTLVNGGILSPNESRIELRYPVKPGHDNLRIPANIAGSAADPSQGGAPPKSTPQ